MLRSPHGNKIWIYNANNTPQGLNNPEDAPNVGVETLGPSLFETQFFPNDTVKSPIFHPKLSLCFFATF